MPIKSAFHANVTYILIVKVVLQLQYCLPCMLTTCHQKQYIATMPICFGLHVYSTLIRVGLQSLTS